MAPIHGGLRNADADAGAGSGGKILRDRRPPPAERTPYARPKPPDSPSPDHPENPNWFAGLIYPARLIASSAGKIISSVFGPESSSSLEDSDSGSYDDEIENDVSNQGNTPENKELSSQTTKSANKSLIEQLVCQEEFSREEGEKLIKLIESREVDGKAGRLNWRVDRSHCIMHSSAIVEAKKWLQEKKSGSGSGLRIGQRVSRSSLAIQPQVTEAEVDSPVDVAKSYMQSRLPWASPSLKYVEFKTPSRQSLDELPMSIFSSSLRSPELKQNSLATGSWNISEEIRKVRSKAAEELLASTSAKKIDATLSPYNRNLSKDSSPNEMKCVHRLHNFNSDVSDLDTNMCMDFGFPNDCESPVTGGSTPDRSQKEVLLTSAAFSVPEQIEDGEANKKTVEKDEAANIGSTVVSQKQLAEVTANGQSESNGNSVAENGLAVSTCSLSARVEVDQNQDLGTTNVEAGNAGDSSHGKEGDMNGSPVEGNLTRDVAAINEHASLGSGSEESTSLQLEEISQDSDLQNTKQGLTSINKKTRAQVRRRKNARRGRGRGGK